MRLKISVADLRPRSRNVFGCGGGVRRGVEASAGDTSANQRDGVAFRVREIFGGFRRKRSPINNFAYFLRASASPREISSAAGDCREPVHPCSCAVQSVTTFASRTPLPPFIFCVFPPTKLLDIEIFICYNSLQLVDFILTSFFFQDSASFS